MPHIVNVEGGVDLQKTLASMTQSGTVVNPHHPIDCRERLFLFEDGRFACQHAEAPPENLRTKQCIDHSIAVLLFEELWRQRGLNPIPGAKGFAAESDR